MPSTRRRGPGRKFKKGEGGRPKGRKNNRTIVREYIGLGKDKTLELFENGDKKLKLKPRHERIAQLLRYAPSAVSANLERELMLHSWGRPKETVEITGKLDVTAAVVQAFREIADEDDPK